MRGCPPDGVRTLSPKGKTPPLVSKRRGELLATSYFRTTYRSTIIGAAAFNFRVRNGNGWCHCARITRSLTNLRPHLGFPEILSGGESDLKFARLPATGLRYLAANLLIKEPC